MDSPVSLLTAADLSALVECGRELAAEIDWSDLVQRILDKAAALTDSPDTSIILHNCRRDSLYFAGATGDRADFLLTTFGESSREQVSMDSLAGEVFRTGQSQIINQVEEDPRHSKVIDGTTKKTTQTMVCVPLNAAGERVGVVQLLNKRNGPYTERDRVLLEHFAQQAAVAIRNARLVEDLVAQMGLYGSREGKAALRLFVDDLNRPMREEELTVMFVDMRGFTRLCQEVRNPAQIQQLLNEYLAMTAEEVVRHGGIVNKFLGDGLLAMFRQQEPARRAVLSAFRMVERFASLKAAWDKGSNIQLGFLDIGIGLATDSVMIGPIGSSRFREFTVIGNAVNLAAFFERAARGDERILADHKTYLQAGDLVEKVEQPEALELKHVGQSHGQSYKKYVLRPKPECRPAGKQVFLSHNSKDKPSVRELAEALQSRGLTVWLDEWELIPGRPWQAALEEVIKTASSAAILVGKDGLGPWEIPEMRCCLLEFVERQLPVIPVLMPGAPAQPALPLFLRQFTWVDLRGGITPEGLDRLQWGITGENVKKTSR